MSDDLNELDHLVSGNGARIRGILPDLLGDLHRIVRVKDKGDTDSGEF
jgi:hypothetical protein